MTISVYFNWNYIYHDKFHIQFLHYQKWIIQKLDEWMTVTAVILGVVIYGLSSDYVNDNCQPPSYLWYMGMKLFRIKTQPYRCGVLNFVWPCHLRILDLTPFTPYSSQYVVPNKLICQEMNTQFLTVHNELSNFYHIIMKLCNVILLLVCCCI